MGGKLTRPGKHLCFCIAYLILLSGCAAIQGLTERQKAQASLTRAGDLFTEGNYEAALKVNQEILSVFEKAPPADQALFNIALIYAHGNNPLRDFRKSTGQLRRLVRDHPRSPFARQAAIWLEILEENRSLRQEVGKLSEIIEESKRIDLEIERKKRTTR